MVVSVGHTFVLLILVSIHVLLAHITFLVTSTLSEGVELLGEQPASLLSL